jgi:hypothetical protein
LLNASLNEFSGNYTKDLTDSTYLQSLKSPNPSEEELIDANIAEHVRLTAHRIIDCTAPSRRVSLTGLLKEIPLLARLRRYPERIPLTMQALVEVLETREAFALRRLQKAVQEYQQQKILPSRSQLISKAHLWRQIDESFIQQAIDEALVALSQLVTREKDYPKEVSDRFID